MSDTHVCAQCGGSGVNLTTNSCNNPCGVAPGNTAACESLPSQIQNFTTQFFGEVVKTEVNGVVSWSLPCSLDIGLPANPRGVGEGLACYFLRLFNDGITGLKGDKGATGPAGTDGNSAYTVSMQGFNQPTLVSPNISLLTAYNPAVSVDGIYVFIDTSGWYLVNGSDGSGTLFLTLIQPLSGAAAYISAGKLVIPSGTPGASITGPAGATGAQGPAGPAGIIPTNNCNTVANTVGVDYQIPLVYAAVTFTNWVPEFLATATGKYLVTVTATVEGQAGVLTSDVVSIKLRNVTNNSDVLGGEMVISNLVDTELKQIVISAIATTDAANQTIALFAECTTANKVNLVALKTTLTYVRVA